MYYKKTLVNATRTNYALAAASTLMARRSAVFVEEKWMFVERAQDM